MKVLHTADWHFREKDFDEIYKCVAFILAKAIEEKPDLICISGDMTDSKNLNLDSNSARAILHIISDMLNIAPVAIVIGTPSHDGHAALALRECRGKYPILVSDMPGQYGYIEGCNCGGWPTIEEIEREGLFPGFILTQIPQPTKQFFINDLSIEDTEKAIGDAMGTMFSAFGYKAAPFDNIPHIVNGHGQIGGAFISETQQLIGHDIEVSKTQLDTLNADLVCYGHIHKAQDMGGGIFYSGSPTRMNHGETEEKGFYVHDVKFDRFADDGSGFGEFNVLDLTSSFIQTPARQMINIKVDYTDDSQEIIPLDYVESMKLFDVNLYSNCQVKFVLTVWQDDASQINKSEIERCFLSAGCEEIKISIIRKPRESVRAERVLEADTLPDKLKAMAELRGEDISPGVIDKAKSIEAGEKYPWKN